MKKIVLKTVIGILFACSLFVGFLYVSSDIGIASGNLETDIRSSQKIKEDWAIDGSVSDTMAAYISYPQDMSDHTFSVYVNRPGLSFGYNERALISMNQQQVQQLQIDDGHAKQAIDIDSDQPFAIVLPINAGSITFYDVNGNAVEYWNHPF